MNQPKALLWQERQSSFAFVESVWSCSASALTSRAVIADPCISIALVKNKHTQIIVMGPKTKPFQELLPAGYTRTTIRLKPGVFFKGLRTHELTDTSLVLSDDAEAKFWFRGAQFQFPDFDHAEQLVEVLYAAGCLGFDAPQNQHGQPRRIDPRRVKRTVGLSPYKLYQLQRSHQALRLLKQGVAATEVVTELAFADQAHLINISRRFFGHTPRQLRDLVQNP